MYSSERTGVNERTTMSKTLVLLNNTSALMKATGIRDRTGLQFAPDGELLYLQGRVCDVKIVTAEVESESIKGAKKTKSISKVVSFTILPMVVLDFSLATRVDVRRILVQPNPGLLKIGRLVYPMIIEPLTGDEIYINVQEPSEEYVVEEGMLIEKAFRLYVIS